MEKAVDTTLQNLHPISVPDEREKSAHHDRKYKL